MDSRIEEFKKLLNKTIDRFEGLAKSEMLGEELGGGSPLEAAHDGVDELVHMYKQAITSNQQ